MSWVVFKPGGWAELQHPPRLVVGQVEPDEQKNNVHPANVARLTLSSSVSDRSTKRPKYSQKYLWSLFQLPWWVKRKKKLLAFHILCEIFWIKATTSTILWPSVHRAKETGFSLVKGGCHSISVMIKEWQGDSGPPVWPCAGSYMETMAQRLWAETTAAIRWRKYEDRWAERGTWYPLEWHLSFQISWCNKNSSSCQCTLHYCVNVTNLMMINSSIVALKYLIVACDMSAPFHNLERGISVDTCHRWFPLLARWEYKQPHVPSDTHGVTSCVFELPVRSFATCRGSVPPSSRHPLHKHPNRPVSSHGGIPHAVP